jgi:hypothetical protein
MMIRLRLRSRSSTTNCHLWLREIKKTFDPNNASESNYYITDK